MSRVRTRPTRADTRQQLFEAAAQLFQEQGIGAASIDAIAEAAGLTRGAFYSNFTNKDELIVAMLEHHVERSVRHYHDMLALHSEPADFLAALRTAERSPRDPLGRAPLLHLELILYVARLERRMIDAALQRESGNVAKAAFSSTRLTRAPVWRTSSPMSKVVAGGGCGLPGISPPRP